MFQLFLILAGVSLLRIKILIKGIVRVGTVEAMITMLRYATVTAIMEMMHISANLLVPGRETCVWLSVETVSCIQISSDSLVLQAENSSSIWVIGMLHSTVS